MNCIKTFTFTTSQSLNGTGAFIKTWGAAPQNYWLYESSPSTSTFNIQGFKNINIYGIEANGYVNSIYSSNYQALVDDWTFILRVNGQNPSVSGNITVSPNNYAIVQDLINPTFAVTKFNPRFNLADPITSATSIQIIGFRAQGIGAADLGTVNVTFLMNFIVYYDYEGE